MTDTAPSTAPVADRLSNLFTTWVVLGLFLDGWAHNAGKPEDFWTPWHGVLYSGFLAGFAYFAWMRRRDARAGRRPDPRQERIALVAFVAFALAGAGDAVWHTLFGVEEDTAALLSPSHLSLMIAGLVLVTGPLREEPRNATTWREAWPSVVALTLGLSVLLFFLQFASPLHVFETDLYTSIGSESEHVRGVVHVLLTNAVILGWLAWLLARRPGAPTGIFTVVLTAVAVLMAGLEGFAHLPLVVGPVLGGVTGDVLRARRRPRAAVLTGIGVVTWAGWFAAAAATFGLGWEIEFWTGSLVFVALTAVGIDLLLGRAEATEASDGLVSSPLPERAGSLRS